MYDFLSYKEYESRKSIEDQIYGNFISEFEIEEEKYKGWKMVGKKVDENHEAMLNFKLDFGVVNCLINKEDSIVGSKVMYVIASSNYKKTKVIITVSFDSNTVMENNVNGE